MTTKAQSVLQSFEQLAEDEKREVMTAIVRSCRGVDWPAMTDDELAQFADNAFVGLDRAEGNERLQAMDGPTETYTGSSSLLGFSSGALDLVRNGDGEVTPSLVWQDISRARAIVRDCVDRGYNKCFWFDMVTAPTCTPHGCLLDCLHPPLTVNRWREAGFYAAGALRRKFPNDTRSWNLFDWAAGLDDVLAVVYEAVLERAMLPAPLFEEVEPQHSPSDVVQQNGFVPWRLFRRRQRVPRRPGIYVLAHFDGLPEAGASPTSEAVIYIGQSERSSVDQRLRDFEKTALGELGHSAGWTYQTEWATDWESLVLFRNTYVTWKAYAKGCTDVPREEERALIHKYVDRFGKRPFLNRKD